MYRLTILLMMSLSTSVSLGDSIDSGYFCKNEKNCRAGDVVIFSFKKSVIHNIPQQIVAFCDFTKTISTFKVSERETQLICIYAGEKRKLRKAVREKNK